MIYQLLYFVSSINHTNNMEKPILEMKFYQPKLIMFSGNIELLHEVHDKKNESKTEIRQLWKGFGMIESFKGELLHFGEVVIFNTLQSINGVVFSSQLVIEELDETDDINFLIENL
jgi:hypothetical protein